jgi:hypothetical protein
MRVIIFALLLLLSIVTIAGANNVYVTPNFQFAHNSGVANIRLTPTQPVKGWELNILFDPTKIQIDAVFPGNFFNGFEAFITPNMIIDNVNGSVTKLYGLVLGAGNKTQDGCLVTIIFTALNVTGVSPLFLVDVGIANETQYLPSQITNGTVQVYGIIPPWDTNGDGQVNHLDISAVIAHYGLLCSPGDPWDVKIDGIVNVYDVSVLVSHYGG